MKLFLLFLLLLIQYSNSFSNFIYKKSTLQSLAAQNLLIYQYSNSFKLNKNYKIIYMKIMIIKIWIKQVNIH